MNAADFQNINLYQWIITSLYFLCPSNRLLFISFLLYIFSIFCTFMGFFTRLLAFSRRIFFGHLPKMRHAVWSTLVKVDLGLGKGIFWTGLYLRWSLSQYHSTREARRVSLWIVINHSDAAWRLSAAARSNFNLPLTNRRRSSIHVRVRTYWQYRRTTKNTDTHSGIDRLRGYSYSYVDNWYFEDRMIWS